MLNKHQETVGNFRESSTFPLKKPLKKNKKNPHFYLLRKDWAGWGVTVWMEELGLHMWQARASPHLGEHPSYSSQEFLRTEFSRGGGHRLYCIPVYSGTEQIQIKRSKRTHSQTSHLKRVFETSEKVVCTFWCTSEREDWAQSSCQYMVGYRLDAQGWPKGRHLTENIWKDVAKMLI